MPRLSQALHGPWPMAVESPEWGWPWLKIDLFSVVVLLLYSPLAFVVAWALALLIFSAASSFCANIKRWYRSTFVSSINGLLWRQLQFCCMTRGKENWPSKRALLAFLDKCKLHLRLCRLYCRLCWILLMYVILYFVIYSPCVYIFWFLYTTFFSLLLFFSLICDLLSLFLSPFSFYMASVFLEYLFLCILFYLLLCSYNI